MMKHKYVWCVGVLLGYILVALVWWFSIIPELPNAVPGLGGDPLQTVWRFIRMEDSIKSGSIVVPEEASFPNIAPLPWIPFAFLFGEQIAYGIAWFSAAILAGWFTFLTARSWSAPPGISFLAGILVLFSPHRLAHALGHFGAMQVWWIPAVLFFATMFVKTKRIRWGAAAVAASIGMLWTEHHLFVALTIVGVIIGIAYWSMIISFIRTRPVFFILSAFAILVFGVGPFLPAVARTASPESQLNVGDERREHYSGTPRSLFSSAPFLLIRGGTTEEYTVDGRPVADHLHTVGMILPVTAFVLSCFSIWTGRRRRLTIALLSIAATGMLIALGPRVDVLGVSIPMPGALFGYLPIISAIRTMGRFIALAVVALPLLVAVHWRMVVPRSVGIGIAILMCIEVLPVFGYPSVLIPDRRISEAITNLPEGSVLSIPGNTDYSIASQDLYLSALHGRTIIGNIALGRVFPERNAILLQTPVVGDLLKVEVDNLFLQSFLSQAPEDVARVAFESQDISGVVLHAHAVGKHNEDRIRMFLRDILKLSEHQASDGVFVYNVTDIASGDDIVAIRGDGWNVIERAEQGIIVSVKDGAKFHIFSTAEKTISMNLILEDIHMLLDTIPPGFSAHSIELEEEIIVRNPRITPR